MKSPLGIFFFIRLVVLSSVKYFWDFSQKSSRERKEVESDWLILKKDVPKITFLEFLKSRAKEIESLPIKSNNT